MAVEKTTILDGMAAGRAAGLEKSTIRLSQPQLSWSWGLGWAWQHELLKTESIVDHDEKHNAQKNEEDEAAIKNNDGSVDKPEGEIKEVNIKVVVNSYS